jgi:hypothetical protein
MPQNTPIAIGTNWTQLTDANVTEITFQNIGAAAVYVTATNGVTAPTDAAGLIYKPLEGEAKRALADIFPGVTGANRVWAKSVDLATQVFVSHA